MFDLVPAQELEPVSFKEKLEEIFENHERTKESIEKVSRFMDDQEVIGYFTQGNEITHSCGKRLFEMEGAVKSLDSESWNKVLNLTGVLDLIPAEKRTKWGYDIREMKAPEFTKENALNTIEALLAQREDFVADKVYGVFKKLSPDHKTNTGFGFSQKLIIARILDQCNYSGCRTYYSVRHDPCEYLRDLIELVRQYRGDQFKELPQTYLLISRLADNDRFGEWVSLDGGAIQFKVFKKGTIHILIEDETARGLNRILAANSPYTVCDGTSKSTKKAKRVAVSVDKLIDQNDSNILFDIAAGRIGFMLKKDLSEDVRDALSIVGIDTSDGFRSESLGDEEKHLLTEMALTRSIPNKKEAQLYQTPNDVVEKMQSLAISSMKGKSLSEISILEPSAGKGNLLKGELRELISPDNVTCVEINKTLSKGLSKSFKNMYNENFIDWSEKNENELYDLILMNPPYSKRQAQDHLETALRHLESDGVLVACLPSTMNGLEVDGFVCDYPYEIIEKAFESEGTLARVTIGVYIKE